MNHFIIVGKSYFNYLLDEQVLVPTLKPGDLVIMDNLSVHKVQGVREAIEAVNAKVVYLPLTAPTSTRSSWHSANSNTCFEAHPIAPKKPCGKTCNRCSTASHQATQQDSSNNGATRYSRSWVDLASDTIESLILSVTRIVRWVRVVRIDCSCRAGIFSVGGSEHW